MSNKSTNNISVAKIEEIYDSIASIYQEHRLNDPNPCNLIDYPFVGNMNLDLKGKDILDAGCGSGFFIERFLLKNKCKSIIGIDISDKMLDIAKERITKENVSFLKRDILDTKLGDNSFDFIFSFVVLDYIESIDNALKELKRILKKDGELIIAVRHPIRNLSYLAKESDSNYFDKGWHMEKWPGTDSLSVYHYYRPISDWINKCIESGLELVGVYETSPDNSVKLDYPDFYDKYLRIPRGLIIRLKK